MYKLLTTAAVIMTVATPSIANDWKNAKDVIKNLETIYTSLDGNNGADSHFQKLQGDITATNGELSDFLSEVDKGVTHVTLTVSPIDNTISTKIEAGSTLLEIQEKQTNLVNRVNYDLFVETSETTFDSTGATDYTLVRPGGFNVGTPGSPGDIDDNQYVSSHDAGLAGVKINKLVDNVNLANDYLVATDRTKDQSDAFIAAWGLGANGVDSEGNPNAFGGSDIAAINSDITDLNKAITTARIDNSVDGEGFFGNISFGGIASDGSNINSFLIPSFTDPGNIGNAGAGNYTSISAWANEIQSVTVNAGVGTLASTGTVTIDDPAAGTITVSGVSDGTEGTYTYADGVFVKN